MSGNKQTVDDVKRRGQEFTGNVNVKRMLEDDIVVTSKSTTTVTIAVQRFDIMRNQEMHLCIGAIGQNYAGGDTATFKFYRKIGNTPYLAETLAVTTPAANTALAGIADVNPARNPDDYDYYTIEGSLTVIHSGTNIGDVNVSVGKKTEGKRLGDTGDPLNVQGTVTNEESGVGIDGTGSASITDTSSTVTLTQKSEVRNTGTNTVYICEGAGTATDADFPIYPDESILLRAGTFDAICGAGLTSTLKVLQVS